MRDIRFWRFANHVAVIFYFVMLVLVGMAIASNIMIALEIENRLFYSFGVVYSVDLEAFSVLQENQLLIVELYIFFQILGRLLVKYLDVDFFWGGIRSRKEKE